MAMVRSFMLLLKELTRFALISAGVAASIVLLDIDVLGLGLDRLMLGAACAYFTSWLTWAVWKGRVRS